MAKKRKSKKPKEPEKKNKKIVYWIVGAAAVAIAAVLVAGNLPSGKTEQEQSKSFQLTDRETRPVLDPFLFSGQVRMAYAAAKKYPEILNEVFCYCYCDASPFYHKTLLSCFTDKHGAG
jgi:hypothetical protein